jgi:hypothetical protein
MNVHIRWEFATLGDLAFLALCESASISEDRQTFAMVVSLLDRLVEGGVVQRPLDELLTILDQVQRGLLNYVLWLEPKRAAVAWGPESIELIPRVPRNLN